MAIYGGYQMMYTGVFNKKGNKIKGLTVLIMLVLFISAFYTRLTLVEYSLKSSKIKTPIKILQISDLHSCILSKNQKELIEKIKKIKPDLIAMTGDIADDVRAIEGTELLVEGIKDVAPIYYVSGNHEYWSTSIANIKSLLIKNKVHILENESKIINVRGNNITFCGVEDPECEFYNLQILKNQGYNSWDDMFRIFSGLKKEASYNVLLSHRPERIDLYRKYNFDLVLSGHAHGGQVRIPFILNGLYAPNQGLFPKYAGGLYRYHNLVHIVSRGMSVNPRLPRVFNPPELVVIYLK